MQTSFSRCLCSLTLEYSVQPFSSNNRPLEIPRIISRDSQQQIFEIGLVSHTHSSRTEIFHVWPRKLCVVTCDVDTNAHFQWRFTQLPQKIITSTKNRSSADFWFSAGAYVTNFNRRWGRTEFWVCNTEGGDCVCCVLESVSFSSWNCERLDVSFSSLLQPVGN